MDEDFSPGNKSARAEVLARERSRIKKRLPPRPGETAEEKAERLERIEFQMIVFESVVDSINGLDWQNLR